ncbi:MAG: S-layer homology domain-containing protein, partial [cyanobacterium endosymbiont of Rhopalodia fuxianensis]
IHFSDINQVPEALRPYVQDIANLGILTAKKNNQFNPNESITRREYARWLVEAKNKFYQDSPEQQIRLGLKNAQPAFSDVPSNDPDFPVIQGLAEAGLISSHLTGDSNTFLFRPDELLTRSDLIVWKVPLDMGKSLPKASIDGIKETWGFQDTTQIDPIGLRGLYADFQNGEQGNVRRVFGYTMLFQPKKTVTRAQAAAALWYFGYQGDGLSAEDVLKRTGNS